MKKIFSEKCRKMTKTAGCLLMAAVLAVGYLTYREGSVSDLPELTTYTDPDTIEVPEEDVPLASTSKTTKKVTQKVTTKKTKMAKKATKTSTTTKKSTKNTNKSKSTSGQQIKINTKVDTTIKTQTKKNSNIKTTQTKVVTTVVTTTTTLQKQYSKTAQATTASASTSQNGTYAVRNVAKSCDNRVLSAFEKMGCKVVVNSSVSYAGCFDAAKRTITLKRMDSTVYHELGHFLEFTGGTSDVKKLIEQAYSKEKSLYTSYNKSYVLQSSGEYFAESFKNYCENPSALKKSRPLTYDAIVRALNNVTDSRVNMIKSAYASVWK